MTISEDYRENQIDVSPALARFATTLGCPRAVQLVRPPGIRRRVRQGDLVVDVASAASLLRWLP